MIMKPVVGPPIIESDVPDAFAGVTVLAVNTDADGSIDLFAV